ncbi:TPA: hypothetical protein ACLEB8_005135 [Pseudomonas aeruginosa]
MPLKRRKPSLGRYNATRKEWYEAYRIARIAIVGGGFKPDHKQEGVRWKAQLIVAHERDGQGDLLRFDAPTKLQISRLTDELLCDQ